MHPGCPGSYLAVNVGLGPLVTDAGSPTQADCTATVTALLGTLNQFDGV